MDNVTEVARVLKHWLTLKSDITEDQRDFYLDLDLEPDIEAGKQGLDGEIDTIRQQFANLLFGGSRDWLYKESTELETALPEWFLPDSNDEYYLQQYAMASAADVKSALNFLSARLAMWARGEGRPQQNPDYAEGTWPAGTQYYMYDGQQWLYSPVGSGPGADWQTMEFRSSAAAASAQQAGAQTQSAPATVDLSTTERAQEAAHDVSATAQDILERVLSRNPACAAGVDPERMKQLVVEALKAQQ
jgi:hypothetical protein